MLTVLLLGHFPRLLLGLIVSRDWLSGRLGKETGGRKNEGEEQKAE